MKIATKTIASVLLVICIMLFCVSCSNNVKEVNEEVARLKELDVEYSDMFLIESLSELMTTYESLSEDEKSKIEDQAYMNKLIEIYPKMEKFTRATTLTIKRFIRMLKDPSSLTYAKNYISGYCIPEKNYYIFKIDYYAKNSFGAYTGEQTVYGIYNDGSIHIYESSEQYLYISIGYDPITLEKDNRIVEFVVSKSTLEDIQDGKYLY